MLQLCVFVYEAVSRARTPWTTVIPSLLDILLLFNCTQSAALVIAREVLYTRGSFVGSNLVRVGHSLGRELIPISLSVGQL